MLNRTILMGRMVVDPELKQAGSTNVCKFRVAVERPFVGSDGQRQTDFISCQAWGRTADFITKYFVKGQMIALEGALRQETYTGSDGKEKRNYVVNVDNASFCGSKEDGGKSAAVNVSKSETAAKVAKSIDETAAAVEEDDLPF